MEVYLIRHTTPKITPGLIYGHLEVELADDFQKEIDMVLSKIPVRFDRVFSSPSVRCLQMAREITPDFVTDERLRELNFGEWEGRTWDNVDQQDLQVWMDDFVNVRIPGGESMADMQARLTGFWHELKKSAFENVLIVTHGGVIRVLLSMHQGSPPDRAFEIKVAYGQMFTIRI